MAKDLARMTLLDLISDAVNNNNKKYLNYVSRKKKYAKILATAIGLTSGLPWIESSIDAGRGYPFLGYAIAGSMLVAFGATTTAVCFDIVDDAVDEIHPKLVHLCDQSKKEKAALQHLLYHALAALATIPAGYLAVVFNSGSFLYVPLVVVVSYIFYTFGYYKLFGEQLFPLLNGYMRSSNVISQEEVLRNQLIKAIDALITRFNNGERLLDDGDNLSHEMVARTISSEIERVKCVEQRRQLSLLSRMTSPLFTAVIVSVNSVVRTVFALKALSFLPLFGGLQYLAFPFIALPTLGLDLYSVNAGMTALYHKGEGIILGNEKEDKSLLSYFYPYAGSAIAILAISFSIISSLNDAYVAENQVQDTFLQDYLWIILICFYLSKVSFESLGFNSILSNSFQELSANKNLELRHSRQIISNLETTKKIITVADKESLDSLDNELSMSEVNIHSSCLQPIFWHRPAFQRSKKIRFKKIDCEGNAADNLGISYEKK